MAMDEATKKRSRDQFDAAAVSGSVTSDDTSIVESKRHRFDESEEYYSSSPESKQSEETIIDILVNEPEIDSSVDDHLDAVIRSFDEMHDPAHDQLEDIGYLMRASDDELGLLPPTSGCFEWGFRGASNYSWSDDMSSFDPGMIFDFDDELFGCGYDRLAGGYGDGEAEFLAVDGLFDCAVAVTGSEWADL